MRTLSIIIAAALLAACDQEAPTPKRTEAFFSVRLVDEITHAVPGHTVHGTTRCANAVCQIEILKSGYPYCLAHEIRHVLEDDWHEGRETTWDCER